MTLEQTYRRKFRRWGIQKLHMELYFARAFKRDYRGTKNEAHADLWLQCLEDERVRRGLRKNFSYHTGDN